MTALIPSSYNVLKIVSGGRNELGNRMERGDVYRIIF